MKRLVFSVALLLLFGCDRGDNNSTVDRITKGVSDTFSRTAEQIRDLAPSSDSITKLPDMTSEEIEKLFTFEYKVIEVENSLPNSEIESRLSRLGLERWECFHVEKNGEFLRIFCRRYPKTFLRYMQHIPFL